MILTIIVFILILGLLIFAHELGHFISAKKAGVKVEEFGFGFPPRIFSFRKGETIYSLNLIPIGGFVKIFGENPALPEDSEKSKSPRAFYNKPIWQRTIIVIAGVIMNLFLAVILLSIIHGLGVPSIVEQGQETNYHNIQIQIVEIAKDSPAQIAGIKIGDAILELKIKNQKSKVSEIEDVQKFIAFHVGEEITITIKRGNEIIEKVITPRVNPPKEQGALGIAMLKTGVIAYPWHQAILKGFVTAWQMLIAMLGALWALLKTLIFQGKMIAEIAGPVGIFSLTSQFVKLGWIYVLQFTAILSINLAILNALPFPALDGGRLLFLLIEKIKGKPIKFKTERVANTLGFAILIGLMILITIRDVIKLF